MSPVAYREPTESLFNRMVAGTLGIPIDVAIVFRKWQLTMSLEWRAARGLAQQYFIFRRLNGQA